MNPREAPRSDGVAGFPEMSLSHFPLWKPRLYLRGKPCQRFPGYHWVAISSSWGILPTQGSHTRPFCVSCTGRRILYHRATWEATREVQRLGGENPLKEEMASPLPLTAWKTPWAEAPGGLQSMGLAESDRRVSAHSLCRREEARECWCSAPPPAGGAGTGKGMSSP